MMNLKNLAIGLLLVNNINCIYASENLKPNKDDILTIKQNLNDNLCNNIKEQHNTALDNTDVPIKETEDNKILALNKNNDQIDNLSHYEENDMNDIENDDINYHFDNWTYNGDDVKDSTIVAKYKELSDQLQRNNTQLIPNLKSNTDNNDPKIRKISSIGNLSVKSYFSNPVKVSNTNALKKYDEYLSGDVEILPIITIQSDGFQVLDSIAQLTALNDMYSFNNFGTSPYIYCASSASMLGLSIAMDLQKNKDIKKNLSKIGDRLLQDINQKTNTDNKKKCCCSCSLFKLFWFNIFGCCIDYDDEPIIDSMYSRISKNSVNSIIKDSLKLNSNTVLNIPNLVVKDTNTSDTIIKQVTDANNQQNLTAIKNGIKLFTEPFISVLKNFVSSDNKKIENGINIVESNIKNYGLVKITSQDTINFINKKDLFDNKVNRVAIVLDFDVDNNSTLQNDANNLDIDLQEVDLGDIKDKLRTVKISLHTAKSIINPDYSLENKYNNWKEILSNSADLKCIISNLPNSCEPDNSNVIVNINNDIDK